MGGPSIALPAGRDPHGLPFGLQLLGPVRGDARLLAAARAIEAFLQQDSETARPRPDPARLVPPPVDLRAIVTHPPLADHTIAHDKLGTAV